MPTSRRPNHKQAALMAMIGMLSSRSSRSARDTMERFVPHCTMASMPGNTKFSLITFSHHASGTCAMSVAEPHFRPAMRTTSKPISVKNLTTLRSPISWYGVIIVILLALKHVSAALHASAPVAMLRPVRSVSVALNSLLPSQPPKKVSSDMPMMMYCGSAVINLSTVWKICLRNISKKWSMSSSVASFGESIKIPDTWKPIPSHTSLFSMIMRQ
mmetsp:Transcript_38473/g.110463  ORF Transcript_38473/g.110463 Transcript_38473/m.110463 type:complete len:215 (-) Transcript_38473:467-1111(-)